MAQIDREIEGLEEELEELEKKVTSLKKTNMILQGANQARFNKPLHKVLDEVDDLDNLVIPVKRSQAEFMTQVMKLSGMSIVYVKDDEYKVRFHPMISNTSTYDPDTWSATIVKTEDGFNLGACWLPECISLDDLDLSQPLIEVLTHISDLLDAYQQRKAQYMELEETLAKSRKSINSFRGFSSIHIFLSISSDDEEYHLQLILQYKPIGVLPYTLKLRVMTSFPGLQKGNEEAILNREDLDALQEQCQPFLKLPLLQAFKASF